MNIDKYLKTIKDLNHLIESVTDEDIKDVESSIELTKQRLDALQSRIQSKLNKQNIPFSNVRIEFLIPIKTSVRETTKKYEIEIDGRQDFDVVGYDENENFIVIRKKEWNSNVGLILYYKTLETRRIQENEYQLFYNSSGNLSGLSKTRSGSKEGTSYQFISLS
jgi:hypothetical protein